MNDKLPRFDPERDQEWRARLTELQYRVTRESGTERPNTGTLYMENRKGDYRCICCGHLLFTSEMKYHSKCGWPAFHTEHPNAGIRRLEDRAFGMLRVEVQCSRCKSHLGHVFPDGPRETTGQRYCMNSLSLTFEGKPENPSE